MRFAKAADMPRIAEIWQQGFGDSPKEIADFFDAFYGRIRVALWEEDNRIAGQLCLIPVSLTLQGGESLPLYYIYAVATSPESRGRGVCTRLLADTAKWLQEEKTAAFLVPADEALAAFYERRGFSRLFAEEVLSLGETVWEEAISKPLLEPVGATEYMQLRKGGFAGKNHVEVPDEYLSHALHLHTAEGGICARLTVGGREYGVLYRSLPDAKEALAGHALTTGQKEAAERTVLIQEITAADNAEAIRAAQALLAALGEKKAVLRRSYTTLGIGIPATLPRDGFFNLPLS